MEPSKWPASLEKVLRLVCGFRWTISKVGRDARTDGRAGRLRKLRRTRGLRMVSSTELARRSLVPYRRSTDARPYRIEIRSFNLRDRPLRRHIHNALYWCYELQHTLLGEFPFKPEDDNPANDYAVAKLIEKVANSPYKSDTLIFILEDDSQDGADHVDSHRSTGYVVGPYVKHGAVISEKYTTVNMLRTIEDILNVDHVDVLTASEKPMTKVFDLNQREWTFDAVPSIFLYNTQLPFPPPLAQNKSIPKTDP